jgi:hypothetical protein
MALVKSTVTLLFIIGRYENGLQTTGLVRNGAYVSAAAGFDAGRFLGRNLWDRRYPVVDEERGIVLSMVRFGLKDGPKSQYVHGEQPHRRGVLFRQARIDSGSARGEVQCSRRLAPQWPSDYGPGRGGAGW